MKQLLTTDFKWHRDQGDVPGMSAGEMKAFLDAPTHTLMQKVNEIIGEDGAPSLTALGERQSQVEKKVTSFVTESVPTEVPQAVIEGASALVDKALSHDSSRLLRFMVTGDAHQKNDNELITKGTKELSQAMAAVSAMMGFDFVANLGDVAWGGDEDTAPVVIDQIKTYKRFCADALKGQRQLWCPGNHDDASHAAAAHPEAPLVSSQALRALMLGATDPQVVYDTGHENEGYYYIDFAPQKVRLIMLNTEQSGDNCSLHQMLWFATVALQMGDKEGWSVLTMAHRPLDYNQSCLAPAIVKAFIDKSFYMYSDGTNDFEADFSHDCTYIGHIHAHAHAFSVVNMRQSGREMGALEMCIPNACYGRNNQNRDLENEHFSRFSTPETYNKSDVDGLRTAFNVVTIDLERKVVYLDNYGAGIDRAVSYDFHTFVNLLPVSVDTDGSVFNVKGFQENTRLDSTTGILKTELGYSTTGFMPIPYGSSSTAVGEVVLHFKNLTLTPGDDYMRVAYYDKDKNFIGLHSGSHFVPSVEGVKEVYTLDASGNIQTLDATAVTGFFKMQGKEVGFCRVSAKDISSQSIITVNEEIV